MEVYLIISILLASVVLPMFMVNKVFLPSDNKIQLSIVDQIRLNKHRFIAYHSSYLFCDMMMYPQFLFWVLSFLSMKNYKRAARYLFIVFHFLSTATFLAFLWKLYPLISQWTALSREDVLLYAGAIYILTPFSYNINNAKNTGISARGLGLFLGQIVLYSTILYSFSGEVWYLVLSGISMWFIFIGSTFALQMLIFVIPAWALIEGDWMIALPLLGALTFFFIAFPKWYAKNYFIGQYGFKVFYFKYLAKNILLTKRSSVWRDFIWDFWKIAFNKFRHKGKITKGLLYIYDNPAMAVLIGLPFGTFIIAVELYSAYNVGHLSSDFFTPLTIPVLLCFGAFLLTSFRSTRFLGEPERYVEFATGLIAIISLNYLSNPMYAHMILLFCIAFIIFQLIAIRLRLKEKAQPGFFNDIELLEAHFDQNVPGEVRILSNNNQICKLMISENRKVFFGWPSSDQIGSFHFTELYKSDQFIKAEMLVPVVNEFNIDYLVLDKEDLPANDPLFAKEGIFQLIIDLEDLALYRINK